MYGTVGKVLNPLLKVYDVTQNLTGALGSLGTQSKYRR